MCNAKPKAQQILGMKIPVKLNMRGSRVSEEEVESEVRSLPRWG